VEIAHEALIRQWHGCPGWLETNREDCDCRRLTAETQEWSQPDVIPASSRRVGVWSSMNFGRTTDLMLNQGEVGYRSWRSPA
jgi:hypothetical protein